jgi:hypothetical protein
LHGLVANFFCYSVQKKVAFFGAKKVWRRIFKISFFSSSKIFSSSSKILFKGQRQPEDRGKAEDLLACGQISVVRLRTQFSISQQSLRK